MTLLHLSCIAAGLLAGIHHSAHAIDELRGSAGNAGAGITNCVSHDWIHFGSRYQSAVLTTPTTAWCAPR